MKRLLEEYSRIIGFLLLMFVVILLLSTPSMIFAHAITMIDTELSYATDEALTVRSKLDFGNNEHMRALSNEIGGWIGSDYDTAGVAERLGADVMLMRDYINPDTFQPVILLVLQSNNRSSFHPPIVCYPALGYTIEEEGTVEIPVQNMSWVEGPWFGAVQHLYPNVTVTAKKLIVTKQSGGKVTDRRVVLYFYVKNSPFTSDTTTMVRVSALAAPEGSYDGILNLTTTFMAYTVPCMFELRQDEDPVILILMATNIGKLMVGLILLLPLLVMFYPRIRNLKSRRE